MSIEAKRRRILEHLAAPRDGLRPDWHREDELPRASFDFLQRMYHAGLIDGSGRRDDRGTGNYKFSRYWKITDKGRAEMAKAP